MFSSFRVMSAAVITGVLMDRGKLIVDDEGTRLDNYSNEEEGEKTCIRVSSLISLALIKCVYGGSSTNAVSNA